MPSLVSSTDKGGDGCPVPAWQSVQDINPPSPNCDVRRTLVHFGAPEGSGNDPGLWHCKNHPISHFISNHFASSFPIISLHFPSFPPFPHHGTIFRCRLKSWIHRGRWVASILRTSSASQNAVLRRSGDVTDWRHSSLWALWNCVCYTGRSGNCGNMWKHIQIYHVMSIVSSIMIHVTFIMFIYVEWCLNGPHGIAACHKASYSWVHQLESLAPTSWNAGGLWLFFLWAWQRRPWLDVVRPGVGQSWPEDVAQNALHLSSRCSFSMSFGSVQRGEMCRRLLVLPRVAWSMIHWYAISKTKPISRDAACSKRMDPFGIIAVFWKGCWIRNSNN